LIRDNGSAFYNHINAQGYEECEDDIQAVSGIAEDIRDALLNYQVGDNSVCVAVGQLKPGLFDRWPSSGRYMTRIAG